MDQTVQFRLSMEGGDLDQEKKAASADASYVIESMTLLDPKQLAPLTEARFLEPVSIIATATIAIIALRLFEHWLSSKEHGVQIDARDKPPLISRIAGIPAGFLVLIAPNGTTATYKVGELSVDKLIGLVGEVMGNG